MKPTLDDLTLLLSDNQSIEWERLDSEIEDAILEDLRALERLIQFHEARRESASDEPLPFDRWGKLRLIERLGAGGFGEVFRARDDDLQRDVALKLIRPERSADPQRRAAILDEGRILASLNHSNVATVYDASEHQGQIGLAMELIQGRTLEALVLEESLRSAREAVAIGLDLCKALSAVHQAGLVHGDITARNVMRDEQGRIVLMDFGLGRSFSSPARNGRVQGTPLYLSPEALAGSPTTVSNDIYSVGVLLYFLVTGSFPVEASSLEELKRNHQARAINPLTDQRADLPDWFVRLVESCLRPDPGSRPASAGELYRLLLDGASTASMPQVKPLASPALRRLPLLLILIALVAGLVTAVIFWPSSTTTSEVRWVVIATTDNRSDVEEFDTIPNELLEITLSRSTNLRPVGRDRLGNVLSRMGQEAATRITRPLAVEIATRENFFAVIQSGLIQTDAGFELSLTVVDARGRALQRLSRPFQTKSEIFEVIKQLSGDAIGLLDRAPASDSTLDLERVTTGSLEALHFYSRSREHHVRGEPDLALQELEEALKLDPHFVMAHARLGLYLGGSGRTAEAFESLQKAFDYRERLEPREKYFVEAEYYAVRGQYREALSSYKAVVAVDPYNAEAYRQIGHLESNLLSPAAAIGYLERAASIEPSPLHWGMLAILFAESNQPDKALAVIRQARSLLPAAETRYLYWGEGLAHLTAGDPEAARRAFEELGRDKDPAFRSYATQFLGRVEVYQGNLQQAATTLREGRALDRRQESERSLANRGAYLAVLLRLMNRPAEAFQELSTLGKLFEDLPSNVKPLRELALQMTRLGHLQPAEEIRERLDSLAERFPSELSRGAAAHVAGEIARARGALGDAGLKLAEAREIWPDPLTLQSLAWYRMELAQWEEAAQELELILGRRGQIFRSYLPTIWVRAHLDLADCLERLGRSEEASRRRAEFVRLWGDRWVEAARTQRSSSAGVAAGS